MLTGTFKDDDEQKKLFMKKRERDILLCLYSVISTEKYPGRHKSIYLERSKVAFLTFPSCGFS